MTLEDRWAHRSRVAVLGMLADLHELPAHYDVMALGQMVKDLRPELLCAEICIEDWRAGDLSLAPMVYRASVVPQAREASIVVVPIAVSNGYGGQAVEMRQVSGLRSSIIRHLNEFQRWLERQAVGPHESKPDVFDEICDWLCALQLSLSGPDMERAWEETNRMMLTNVLTVIGRDPGRRVLVTVDCRRRRWFERELRGIPGLELVGCDEF